MFMKMHHPHIPCSAALEVESFIPMGVILGGSSASVEHLNASWMVLGASGGIIENRRISEQRSLVIRDLQVPFGLWNSILQPHLNSNEHK